MTEAVSQRQLAREYGVSRRLITFIVNPESEERNKELLRENKGNPPLVRAPVNSFEFQPCDRTPQVGYLLC